MSEREALHLLDELSAYKSGYRKLLKEVAELKEQLNVAHSKIELQKRFSEWKRSARAPLGCH